MVTLVTLSMCAATLIAVISLQPCPLYLGIKLISPMTALPVAMQEANFFALTFLGSLFPLPSSYRSPRNRSTLARYSSPLSRLRLDSLSVLHSNRIASKRHFCSSIFPVLFAIWYGGFRPGVMATTVSAVLANYFFLEPYNHLSLGLGQLLRCIFFAVTFIVAAWMVENHHHAAESELATQIDALRASEERVAAIISSAMDAIITVDEQQRVVVFNAAAEQIFGCSASGIIGKPLDQLLPERFRQTHRKHVETFGATGWTGRSANTPATLIGLRCNGEEFPIEATISRVISERLKLYTVILRDISQRIQTERALLQIEKLATVGRLASTVAHEINNPLSAVSDLLYLLKSDPTASDSVGNLATLAESEISRAAQIVSNTLGFSRGGTNPALFCVTKMLDSVLELANRKLEKKAVACDKQYFCEPEIVGVASEIQQVFWNLLTNAADAVGLGGGRITVRVRAGQWPLDGGGAGVFVTFADNGAGINREHLARIFEPFYTTKATGNGLGLWLSKQIIDNHKGTIRLRSHTSGSCTGTSFSIFLPSPTKLVVQPKPPIDGTDYRHSA